MKKTQSKSLQFFNGEFEAYTGEQLGEILGCSLGTIRRYIRQGSLKTRKVGRQHYISRDNLKDFLDGEDRKKA
jgi:excisionase family DNA binding protein